MTRIRVISSFSWTGLLPLAALGIASLGCASPKRDECRALMGAVNTTADRVDKAQASTLDPSGLKALADGLEKSATEADALRLTIPDLQKHAKAYSALTRDIAKTARDMAAAGETHDRPRAEAAGDAMEKLAAQEPKLLRDLNGFCLGE